MRLAPAQDLLETAVHRRIHVRRRDPAIGDVQRHLEIALDAVEGANEEAGHFSRVLLATGGTAGAGIKLIEKLGGEIISCAFIIDLPELGGRKHLESLGMDVHVLCEFDGL